MIKQSLILTLFISFVVSLPVIARPQYASREKLNCIACHVSPWGGGTRKVAGKIYGNRDFEGSINSDSDKLSMDMRMLYIKALQSPNQGGSVPNGLGLMTAQASTYLPIVEKDDYTLSVTANYDFGAFQPGPRETYLIWENYSHDWYKPTSVVVGRFNMPFGVLHDEHRTYTKMQASAGLREYDVGSVFSFDPLAYVHFDIGYVDGADPYRKGPSTLDTNSTFGTVANLRINHENSPLMLGFSHLYNNTRKKASPSPYAYSAYGVFSFSKIFEGVNLDILSEVVWAKNYNVNSNRYMGQFIPNTAGTFKSYRDTIKDKRSRGIMTEVRYEVTPSFILLYKFDELAFDDRFKDDAFIRHGFGFRKQLDANTLLLVKYETEKVTIPNFDGNLRTKFNQNNIFAVLRVWL